MSKPKLVFDYKDTVNGKGPVLFSWSFDFNYLACAGEKQIIYILDKRGKELKKVNIGDGKILSLEWDRDTEYLCIISWKLVNQQYQDGKNYATIWQVFSNNQPTQIGLDNTKAKVCWAKWAKTHGVLAIASDKGGIMFYTKKQSKKQDTMGKHSKKIISGDWNGEGYLITSGEDKLITISNFSSETLFESIPVKAEAKSIQWSRIKTESRDQQQRTVTAVIQQKSIIVFELGKNHKQPDELVFENRYGKIVDYQIFSDGYVIVGFSEGYIVHISTHPKEISDELQSERPFNSIDALCVNETIFKLAVAGDEKIKMFNLNTWKEEAQEMITLPPQSGKVTKIQWSSDGQVLIVATEKGFLYGYLTYMPVLTATCGNLLALQQTFTDVIITETSKNQLIQIVKIELDNEPSKISLSQQFLACSVNNMVQFYKWLDKKQNKIIAEKWQIIKKEYMGFVSAVFVNEQYAAVLSDGKCILHKIEAEVPYEKQFPQNEQEKPNLSIGLTKNFLFLLDVNSKIRVYNIEEQAFIIEFKNEYGFTKIFPNLSGTRSICINQKGQGYIFEASQENAVLIQQFPPKTHRVIWDQKDPNLFITQDETKLIPFIVNKNHLSQNLVYEVYELLSIEDITNPKQLSETIIDKQMNVISLSAGNVRCFSQSSGIFTQSLQSHSSFETYKGEEDSQEGHFRYFLQSLAITKFAQAFKAACHIKNLKLYDTLGRRCLESLEFDVAQRAFQKTNNISMVMMIQSFKHETEKNLLFAYVAMILGQHDLAQDLFLKSSFPNGALDLRCDIQDYANALTLAKQIAPEQEPFICKRLAIQLETQGINPEALKMYERAQLNDKLYDKKTLDSHNSQCLGGIARCSIKMGDILRGISLVKQIKDSQILQEIALVCENMKQHLEAAEIYEEAGVLEKAASLYIQQKMFKQAAPLMNKIRSPKLLALYAKAKESEGAFKDAESAYEKAEEWENVVRLNLNQLENIEKAKYILRNKCQTTSVALMVAQYCEKRGSKSEAVEFYIMAGKKEEAFALAQNYNEMDSYAEHMKAFSLEERLKVAQYYEGKSQLDKAAFHYEKAQDPIKALKLYQSAGEEFIQDMIDLVSRNTNENLKQNLLDYLTGETDDMPKDPQYIYKFYKAIGSLVNASNIAITVASQEQEAGRYKEAHQMMFETIDDIRLSGHQVPNNLLTKFMILHSYTLVKKVMKMELHEDAARLLDRVCKNISQFPAHAANILTTAVLEAKKSNFQGMAFNWAAVLMKQEYRANIHEKFKKQIETIARRPLKDEIQETKTPCPFCGEYVPEFSFECTKCSNVIPFCIASGKHIIAEQCCFCPSCKFPANIQSFRKLLELEPICPVCSKNVNQFELRELPKEEVQKLKRKNVVEEKKK